MIDVNDVRIIRNAVLRIVEQNRRLATLRYGGYYGDPGEAYIAMQALKELEDYFEHKERESR